MRHVTEEEVDDMVSLIKMAGAYLDAELYVLRPYVREKLEEGKVPCFEQRKWVPREKSDAARD